MSKAINYLRWAFVSVGGYLTAALGGWDVMLQVLVGAVVLDYISGVAAAWFNKNLSSEIGAKGIVKKVLIFLVVALAAQVDVLLALANENLQILPTLPPLIRSVAVCFYIANESLSCLENVAQTGQLIPPGLKEALEQVRKGGAKDGTVSNSTD